jgi:hypothetical protein
MPRASDHSERFRGWISLDGPDADAEMQALAVELRCV